MRRRQNRSWRCQCIPHDAHFFVICLVIAGANVQMIPYTFMDIPESNYVCRTIVLNEAQVSDPREFAALVSNLLC